MTMQGTLTMRSGCGWLCLGAVAMTMMMMTEMTAAYSDFCMRPANMELCWFKKINKRFLRFGRGDPFLRFGKRASDAEDREDGGFLPFGRSLLQPSLYDLLAAEGVASRKRRDVSSVAAENEAPELKRSKRDVTDGGFLRFGRGGDVDQEELAAKRGDTLTREEYLRFGRDNTSQFPRWGKRYLRFGRGSSEGFLRFGKRATP